METLLKFIQAITARRAAVAAILFMALYSPGFIALYRFMPREFQSWETWKLLSACGVIAIPSALWCSLLFFLDGDGSELKHEEASRALLIGGSLFSALALHALHFFLLFVPNAGRRHFLYGYIVVHVVFTFAALIDTARRRLVRRWRKKRDAAVFCPEI